MKKDNQMPDHLTTQMGRWPRGRPMKFNRLPAVAALAALALASPLAMPALAQVSSSYATSVLADNPWGYWRLNESADPSGGTLVAVDSSTNHLNGTYGTDIQNGLTAVKARGPRLFPVLRPATSRLRVCRRRQFVCGRACGQRGHATPSPSRRGFIPPERKAIGLAY